MRCNSITIIKRYFASLFDNFGYENYLNTTVKSRQTENFMFRMHDRQKHRLIRNLDLSRVYERSLRHSLHFFMNTIWLVRASIARWRAISCSCSTNEVRTMCAPVQHARVHFSSSNVINTFSIKMHSSIIRSTRLLRYRGCKQIDNVKQLIYRLKHSIRHFLAIDNNGACRLT